MGLYVQSKWGTPSVQKQLSATSKSPAFWDYAILFNHWKSSVAEMFWFRNHYGKNMHEKDNT